MAKDTRGFCWYFSRTNVVDSSGLIFQVARVVPMKTTTAMRMVQELRTIFARFGLLEQIVLDNGPQVVAEEFQEFAKTNGIKYIEVAPYHPAERFVQTFKAA